MFHTNETYPTATADDAAPLQATPETIPVFERRIGSWHLSLQRQPFSTQELTRRYDRAAAGWARTLNRLRMPHAYCQLLRCVLDAQTLARLGERPRVLECGIGTGALAHELASLLPAGSSLDGIDVSPRMLEHARRGLSSTNLQVTLREGDVRKLPYPDGVFDLAMTAHVLEHLADPSTALAEMSRVLKPGGLLIACITRRSTLGRFIQLKWRTHRVAPDQAQRWLVESGLDNVRSLAVGDGAIAPRLSVACVATKIFQTDDLHNHPRRTS